MADELQSPNQEQGNEEAENTKKEKATTEAQETTNTDNNINSSPQLSPLEQAKQIQEENKKLLEDMRKEREKIEKASADLLIGGGSLAGNFTQPKPPTQADKDQEMAERIANSIR